MMRDRILKVSWFLCTAVIVYGVLVVITVGLAMANGEGLSCRDDECGAVSEWLGDAYPLPMITGIAVAVTAGAWMARRRTGPSPSPLASNGRSDEAGIAL